MDGLKTGVYRNLRVSRNDKILEIFLHNNKIITFFIDKGVVFIDDCGFKTKSTARNINKFLTAIDDHRYVGLRKDNLVFFDKKRNLSKVISEPILISLSGRQMFKVISDNPWFLRND